MVLLRRPTGLLGLAVPRVGRRTDLLLKPLHPWHKLAWHLKPRGPSLLATSPDQFADQQAIKKPGLLKKRSGFFHLRRISGSGISGDQG